MWNVLALLRFPKEKAQGLDSPQVMLFCYGKFDLGVVGCSKSVVSQ